MNLFTNKYLKDNNDTYSLESSLDPIEQNQLAEDIANISFESEMYLNILNTSCESIDVIEEHSERLSYENADIQESLEVIRTAGFLLTGSYKEINASLEADDFKSQKLIRLEDTREHGVSGFIQRVFNKIRELVIKFVMFFRKFAAKVSAWLASFTPGLNSLSKFYKDSKVEPDALNKKVDETISSKEEPYEKIKKAVMGIPDLLLVDTLHNISTYIGDTSKSIKTVYTEGSKFFSSESKFFSFIDLNKKGEIVLDENKLSSIGISKYDIKDKTKDGMPAKAAFQLADSEFRQQAAELSLDHSIIFQFTGYQKLATNLIHKTIGDRYMKNIKSFLKDGGKVDDFNRQEFSPFIKDVTYNEDTGEIAMQVFDRNGKVQNINRMVKAPSNLDTVMKDVLEKMKNIKGSDLGKLTDDVIDLYKSYPKFVSDALNAYNEAEKTMKKLVNDARKNNYMATDNSSDKNFRKDYGTLKHSYFTKTLIDSFKLNMAICNRVRKQINGLAKVLYSVKDLYK